MLPVTSAAPHLWCAPQPWDVLHLQPDWYLWLVPCAVAQAHWACQPCAAWTALRLLLPTNRPSGTSI